MRKAKWLLAFAAILVIIGFAFAACGNPASPESNNQENQGSQNQSTVTSVTVTPDVIQVMIGAEHDFTTAVQGTNNPPQTVKWSVEENQHSGTTISETGRLSVHTDEALGIITVRARSTHNTEISGIATVTVTPVPTPVVTSVTVSPYTAVVNRGGTQAFSVTATGANSPPKTVTWSVTGGGVGTSINATSGLLTVATGETAARLTITATSTFNNAIYGTADVAVPLPIQGNSTYFPKSTF